MDSEVLILMLEMKLSIQNHSFHLKDSMINILHIKKITPPHYITISNDKEKKQTLSLNLIMIQYMNILK
jgi:hypothetical protein